MIFIDHWVNISWFFDFGYQTKIRKYPWKIAPDWEDESVGWLIEWFQWFFKLFGINLCQEVRESRLLNVYICMCVVVCEFLYTFIW